VRTYKRDQQLKSPVTELKNGSVHPDQWNKMDVSLAKDPFKHATLDAMLYHLSQQLDCEREVQAAYPDGGEDLSGCIAVLREHATMAENVTDETKSDLLVLQYCASISTIYINLFMHQRRRLTPTNIDDIEARLTMAMEFFQEWRSDQLKAKAELKKTDTSSKAWERWFLAHQTYLHMRIGIVGFLCYARNVFALGAADFVPFLHSNTSILEAYFSQVRRMNRDTPLKYKAAAGTTDSALGKASLSNNKMYDASDMTSGPSPARRSRQHQSARTKSGKKLCAVG
jgi:hypothetical protein